MAKFGSAALGGVNQTATVDVDIARVFTGNAQPAGTVGFDVSGTYVGAISFEATIDDINWFPAAAFPQLLNGLVGAFVTSTSGTGRYFVKALGYSKVRARMSSYTSGSATVASALTADVMGIYPVLRELMIQNELITQGLNLPVDESTDYRNDPQYP